MNPYLYKFLKDFKYVSPHAKTVPVFLYAKAIKKISPVLIVIAIFSYISLLDKISANSAIPVPAGEHTHSITQQETTTTQKQTDIADEIVSRPVSSEDLVAPAMASIILVPPLQDIWRNAEDNFLELKGKISKGETLGDSLQRSNIPQNVALQIVEGLHKTMDFRKLRPGDCYSIILDEKGELVRCIYESGPLEIYSMTRTFTGYKSERSDVLVECHTVMLTGVVRNSLFASFSEMEEGPKLIHSFADIFASKIDFNTEIRDGDRFGLVYEKYFKGHDFIGYGKILYARYEQQVGGQIYEGFYYSDNDKKAGSYFDREGRELCASFIRSPVPVGRVSSKFTTHRKHPILGIVRPHLGIDLAAPRGTPVMAAADGKVKFLGTNGGYGRQIVLSHSDGYESHYGHLYKFRKGLRKGGIVKQKEIIGYIGSSGLATGPHLDYRIRHKGIFVNPFGLASKPKSILTGEKLDQFTDAVVSAYSYDFERKTEPQIIQVKQLTVTPDTYLYFL